MTEVPVLPSVAYVVVVASANGQVEFDFDFLVKEAADIYATHTRGAVVTPLVALADFTVDGLGLENGGSIDITLSGIATLIGDTVTIVRDIPVKRLADYQNDFRTNVVNSEFDKIFMIMQEQRRDLSRALLVPFGETPPDTAEFFEDLIQAGEDADAAEAARVAAEGAAGASLVNAMSRAEAITRTFPDYVEQILTGGYAEAGDGGGARYREIPLISDDKPWHMLTNGDARRWEISETAVTLEMFGGKADGTIVGSVVSGTDNLPAINAAMEYGLVNVFSTLGATAKIQCGLGSYYFSNTIKIKRNFLIDGASGASQGNAYLGTIFLFPTNTVGILGMSAGTIDPDTGLPSGSGGDGAFVRNIQLQSVVGTNRSKHAIMMRCRMLTENVRLLAFSGNGYDIQGDAVIGSNANNWEIRGGRVVSCQNGIFTAGGDSNAGVATHVDCSSNRQAGVLDRSFLGNLYIGGHENGNGILARVSDGVNRYQANPTVALLDDPTPLSVTVPGTDAAIWEPVGAGGVSSIYPLWVNGNEYVVGGQRISSNSNARTAFLGGYNETGSVPNFIIAPAVIAFGSNFATIHPNSTGLIINDRNFDNVSTLTATTLEAEGTVATYEGLNIWTSASLSVARIARMMMGIGRKADGVTKRPAAGWQATVSTGVDATAVGIIGSIFYDGPTGSIVTGPTLNGGTKRFDPLVDNTWSIGSAAVRWLQAFVTKLFFGAGATFITSGAGSPEGAVTGPIGSIYTQSDGTTNRTMWIKESGAGNTGWVPFTRGAFEQNIKSAAYTLVLTDAGKSIYHPAADVTARIWTLPDNATVPYPIGTRVKFNNEVGAGVITIEITTDTLVLVGAAGSTGTRTLAAGGEAVAEKVTATRWRISGSAELT